MWAKENITADPVDAADAIRHEIIYQSAELFAHYGFGKTNIGDIATCCCMSPGNLYRYFRNKQAIGLAVLRAHFEMQQAAMDTELMFPEGTAEDRIRRCLSVGIGHMAQQVEQYPKIVELADFMCENEEGLELLSSHIAYKRLKIAAEIEKGIATGELQSCEPEKTAATILTGLKVFFIPMTLIRWQDRSTILPEMHRVLDLMFRGMRAR